MSWPGALRTDSPYWEDCREALPGLGGDGFPGIERLNHGLAVDAKSGGGQPIRFVESSRLPGADYESHIFQTGEVSTRDNNWHDLFNALCWKTWPAIKSAINRRHFEMIGKQDSSERGSGRDAMTLFDECGAIVVSTSRTALEWIAGHQWDRVFAGSRDDWPERYKVFITGHALLEKALNPYKSMTANTILVETGAELFTAPRGRLRAQLDESLGRSIAESRLLADTHELAPLPVTGIPGWWTAGAQDAEFYADRKVFRPDPGRRAGVTITRV